MEENIKKIEKILGKSANDIGIAEVLIEINNSVASPQSFYYYNNLCTFDSGVHWDLEKDQLNLQSEKCVGFIMEAFNKKP